MGKGHKTLDRYGYNGQADEHDRCKEKDTAKWIARRGILEQQNLSQRPAKAREESSQDDKDKAEYIECRFTSHHHDDTYCHCSDDNDQLNGRVFETEEEGEGEDEG